MSYEIQEVAQRLKQARQTKGLSQRELSALADIPQAQISRIEAGSVDMRLSSLVALVHALDLELALVPRKAVPAVKSLTRQDSGSSSAHAAAKELNRVGEVLRSLQTAAPALEEITHLQKSFAELQRFSSQFEGPEALKRLRNSLEQIHKPREELDAIMRCAREMQALRNTLAHRIPSITDATEQKPAYSLDEDDDG
ncbi:helix-turn-helix domain-containing protein [Halomonas cupida]|uniref:helix-turn-helix domain-containing protein n=1 Tax=Halomonas cupida TaxID=44933 RepID=UPI003A8E20E1